MSDYLELEELKNVAVDVISRAGEIALEGYGRGRGGIKFDDEMVTSFETRIEHFIKSSLEQTFPGHRFFGDYNGSDKYRSDRGKDIWVFDALDGVANYQAGIPMWGMSIGLMENFWPLFGVYYMPSTRDLFWAFADGSAYHNGKKMTIVETEPTNNESLLFTYSRFHDHFNTTFPGKIRNLGCTGAHICHVARGRAEGAVIHNVSFKDLLAPVIILKASGGEIEYFDDGVFHLNDYLDGSRVKEFLLVAPKGYHGQLRGYLERTEVIE